MSLAVRVQAGGEGEGSDRVQVPPPLTPPHPSISDTHLHNWEHLALGKSH